METKSLGKVTFKAPLFLVPQKSFIIMNLGKMLIGPLAYKHFVQSKQGN